MEKILLDTDIGGDIDDAVCLAYLLREPRCELLGITTVCGEPEKRAAVADAICRAAGREIPIVAGLDTTLQPVPVYPTPDGAEALPLWPHRTFEKGDAPAFLYRKIRENPGQVTLIGTGNMTNIATLFTAYPDAVRLLKGLYIMNGYFGAEPLPEPWQNWNAWADPLASKIVFSAPAAVHRVVPLEVTGSLTIDAAQAGVLLPADSELMRAVFSFGGAWLRSAGQLTLHDPLAAVCVFHPELCAFRRGDVEVETEREEDMGATRFTPSPHGKVEVACSADREGFYRALSSTLSGGPAEGERRALPPAVTARAKSAGAAGEAWLANLDATVARLEKEWQISVGEALPGGSHAFTALAEGKGGEPYVLKMDMPEGYGGDFAREAQVLKLAEGRGYPRLFRYDRERKACLLERLGKPVGRLGYPVEKQLEIICATLRKTWEIPAAGAGLPEGKDSVEWFRGFIAERWEALGRPCPGKVIKRAFALLRSREEAINPAEAVLLHGDAHGNNTLRTLSGDGYKLVDPDGLFYEKAYDLGVLMREWREEYRDDPVRKGRERCARLSELTGADPRGIFEWGFLQCVSTGMVLWPINREVARELLGLAESWCALPGPEA